MGVLDRYSLIWNVLRDFSESGSVLFLYNITLVYQESSGISLDCAPLCGGPEPPCRSLHYPFVRPLRTQSFRMSLPLDFFLDLVSGLGVQVECCLVGSIVCEGLPSYSMLSYEHSMRARREIRNYSFCHNNKLD